MTGVLRIAAVLCCLAFGLLPPDAGAHVTATGLAVVGVDGREVSYRLTVVPSELPEPASQLLLRAMAGSRPDAERVADAMHRAVVVRVDGASCRPGRVAIQDVGAGLKALLDYALDCPAAPGRLELEEDWTGLFGEHYQTIATIRTPQGGGGEHLLGEGSARISVDLGTPSPTGLAGFVRLGVMHILTGYDHLLFLFALLAGAANFWQVLGIASMFTLAHSITLSLAVLGLVHAPSAVVEPLIAVSIIWVAVENVLGAGGRLWRRFAVTFVFGLVHGLGFADALSPLALSGWSLVHALAGFNLGVELGQMIAIALVLPVMLVIGRLTAPALVYRYASLAVAAVGAYWLVGRIGFE
jgi:hydrogenase/urease accessory protein HupE